MESLKIAFFCWESLYTERVGGLASAATHMAESLARNHEIHFFTRGKEDRKIKGVHYHCCQPSGDNIVEFCRDMSRQMVDQFRIEDHPPFDLLHFHDWHAVEALHVLQDRPNVLSFHSTEYGRNGGNFGDWWEFGEISGKEWYGGLIARKVITVSQTLKEEIGRLYQVPPEKVEVIPNGVIPEVFKSYVDPGEVKQRYGIHPFAPLILFIGRMVFQKGPDLLAGAIPEITCRHWDTRFIFAGEGHMRQWLTERSTGLPVQFLGWIPDSEYIRLLNACDIVVIPSRNEPFGLVLLEAWSAEKCVVAAEVGGLSENIENFRDGVKVYPTVESVAWGTNFVLDNRSCLNLYGKEGRKRVDRSFKWESVATKVLSVYESVLS
ncbi:MAG: glycosyltransferase family 4 protein [Methanomicrobiales archaeon]|nr:glycosyltransferase family 4 protein [Methanomicrobiales archaeon]